MVAVSSVRRSKLLECRREYRAAAHQPSCLLAPIAGNNQNDENTTVLMQPKHTWYELPVEGIGEHNQK